MNIKKILSVFVVGLLLSNTVVLADYSDVQEHWATNKIQQGVDSGIVEGVGNFRPDENITRYEFATMMNNALKLEVESDKLFADLEVGSEVSVEMLKAVAKGYIAGYEDNTIRPNNALTRQEAATMVVSALPLSDNIEMAKKYVDFASIYDYAIGKVGAVTLSGIMLGNPDGSFAPLGNLTRAEGLIIALNVQEKLVTDTVISKDGTIVKDQTIQGNLVITEELGNGNATIENVVVKGKTIVNGGGKNSLHIKNSDLGELIVADPKGAVRIVLEETTTVDSIQVESGANLEADKTFTGTVETVEIATNQTKKQTLIMNVPIQNLIVPANTGTKVLVQKTVENLTIKAPMQGESLETIKVPVIDIAKGIEVNNVIAESKVEITGSGTIKNLEVKVDGVKTEIKPENIVKDDNVKAPEIIKPETPSTGGSGGGGGGNPTTYHEVRTFEELNTAIADGTITSIRVNGIIGSSEDYKKIEVTRSVEITGGTVYGVFDIKADKVTLDGITINSRGGGSDSLKNAINIIAKDATVQNCTMNLGIITGESGVGNAIVIYPYGSMTANYVIEDNTINGFAVTSNGWGSSGISITEGFGLSERFGITGTSVTVDVDDEAIATANTYVNTTNEYTHTDWAPGENSGKFKFGYFEDGYSSNYASGATMLIKGTVGDLDSYSVRKIERPVKIKGITADGEKAKIYGSFVVIADGVTFENLEIFNEGDVEGQNTASRNAINAACKEITITNCDFDMSSSNTGITNGVSIWPTNENVNYAITGNTFKGYDNSSEGYSSSGLLIAGGIAKPEITNISEASVLADLTDEEDLEMITKNTFEDCKNDYERCDWTGGLKIYAKSTSTGDNLLLSYGAKGSEYYITGKVTLTSDKTVSSVATDEYDGVKIIVRDGATLNAYNYTLKADSQGNNRVIVESGGTFVMNANYNGGTDSKLPTNWDITIEAGGTLASKTTNGSEEDTNFVGNDDNARIKLETGTAQFTFEDRYIALTIEGDATIPTDQTWYTMFDSGSEALGIYMYKKAGTLTVDGTLKIVSANSTGSTLSIENGATVIVNGEIIKSEKGNFHVQDGATISGEGTWPDKAVAAELMDLSEEMIIPEDESDLEEAVIPEEDKITEDDEVTDNQEVLTEDEINLEEIGQELA